MRTVIGLTVASLAACGVASTVSTKESITIPSIVVHSHTAELPQAGPEPEPETIPLVEYTGDECKLNNHAAW